MVGVGERFACANAHLNRDEAAVKMGSALCFRVSPCLEARHGVTRAFWGRVELTAQMSGWACSRSAVRFANAHLNDDGTVVKMGHPEGYRLLRAACGGLVAGFGGAGWGDGQVAFG